MENVHICNMKNNFFQIVLLLVLSSFSQSGNADNASGIQITKQECQSRMSSDIDLINKLTDDASSIKTLMTLSSLYSHCAFYFSNKEIFYSYFNASDKLSLMATHLELYYDGTMGSMFIGDRNEVIRTLKHLATFKS